MKLTLGPSNGWLYAKKIFDSKEQENFLELIDINAIEINLGSDSKRSEHILKDRNSKKLDYISAHFPCYNLSKDMDKILELAKKIVDKEKIHTIVIHPSNVPEEYWKKLSSSNTQIAIENLDSTEKEWKSIEKLKNLIERYNFGFVLDVQHAYEHDHTMKYAQRLFQEFKSRLKHLHLSGQVGGNRHSLVYKSENKKQIIEFTKKLLYEKNIPIILEGKYDTKEELKAEIDFLKSNLLN